MAEKSSLMGVARAPELVEYQKGSIVSRTLVKHKAGSISVFAFDTGEELSEHTVPCDAMVYLIEGTGDFTVDGASHHVSEGELFLMPAHHPHAVRATSRFKMMLSIVRADE
jgi:quercetin dioxygenase-like cupin family protein